MIAVVINREDRTERLKATKEQLDRFGIEFDLFSAITQPGGWKGCRLSHIAVLEKYRNEDMVWVM
jgi:GR25 family glycosyltransferase involved in LPS biosynthesis